jgi:ubiquinone/menaquinone biosynthesis C-methylase UbiE
MYIQREHVSRIFSEKYGNPALGPIPRRCVRFGYFFPDEYYEASIEKLVTSGSHWLDVGGGRDVFPSNAKLARRLADRCGRLVAVDPSPNVLENPFAHERHQLKIEEYDTVEQFDLLSMRMVAEHIDRTDDAVSSIARLLKPGGRLVVYTVDKWSLLAVAARIVPFQLHHPIKRVVWQTEEQDTFPVFYRMNTRSALKSLATKHGLHEESFNYLDDCRTFHRYPFFNHLELGVWRVLKAVGIRYLETCLLGVYRRNQQQPPTSTDSEMHKT